MPETNTSHPQVDNNVTSENGSTLCSPLIFDLVEWESIEYRWLMPLHITLCTTSVMVSLVNMVVFTRPDMISSPFNNILTVLEACNFIYAACNFTGLVIVLTSPDIAGTRTYMIAQRVLSILDGTAANLIIWISVYVAVWRCVAVTWPLKAHLTRVRALTILAPLGLLCFVLSLPLYFLENSLESVIVVTCPAFTTNVNIVGNTSSTWWWILLIYDVLVFWFPSVCVVLVNALTVWNLFKAQDARGHLSEGQDARERGHNRSTIILVCLVTAFVICNTSPSIPDLQLFSKNPLDLPHPLAYICQFYILGLAVNSLSIFGYFFMSTTFRETFMDVFSLNKCFRLIGIV